MLCAQNNIKLIVIPEIFNITPLSKLGPLVKDQCEGKGVPIPNYEPSEGMDFNQAYKYPYGNEMLAKLHKIAQNKGGECLATTWLGSETKLPFVCALRHEFRTIPSDILGGHWCLICSGRAPIGLKTVQAFAKSHQGECLNNTYKNTSSLLKFTCKNGTIFEMTWANISKRKVFCRCGKCLTDTPPAHRYHGRKALGIQAMHELAKPHKGKCTSATYINGATYLSWTCRHGSPFEATYNQIVARKWFCPCLECRAHTNNYKKGRGLQCAI